MKMHHRLIAVEQECQAGEHVTCERARQTRQGEDVCLARQHETETSPRDNPAELQGSNYITDQIRAAYIICVSMFRQSTSRIALGCFRTVSDEEKSEINNNNGEAGSLFFFPSCFRVYR